MFGDFQSLKPNPDEHRIQPIEASQLGEWISPHRLTHLSQLLWHAEADEAKGLYRCRNGYQPPPADDANADAAVHTDTLDEWDDAEAYDYT